MQTRNSLWLTLLILGGGTRFVSILNVADCFLWLCAALAFLLVLCPSTQADQRIQRVVRRFVSWTPKVRRSKKRIQRKTLKSTPTDQVGILLSLERAIKEPKIRLNGNVYNFEVVEKFQDDEFDYQESATATTSSIYDNPWSGLSEELFERNIPDSTDVWQRRKTMSEGHLPSVTIDEEENETIERNRRKLSAHHPTVSFALPSTSTADSSDVIGPSQWTSSASSGDLRHFPFDLSHYRRRIDANVAESRNTRELVEDLQDKIRNFRQHQAHVEASIAAAGSPRFAHDDWKYHRSMSSLDDDLNEFTTTRGNQRAEDATHQQPNLSHVRPASSGGRLKGDSLGVCLCGGCRGFGWADIDLTISTMQRCPHFRGHDATTRLKTNSMSGDTIGQLEEIGVPLEYSAMDTMLQTYRRQMETILRSNEKLNVDLHNAREDIERLKCVRSYTEKIEQLEAEANRRSEDLRLSREAETNLKAQLNELQEVVERLQNDLQTANNQIENLRSAQVEELERTKRELMATHTEKVDELEATLDSVRSNHHHINSTLTETRRELATVQAERDAVKSHCQRMEMEIQRLRSANEHLTTELTEATTTLEAEQSAAFQRQSLIRDEANAQIKQQRAELLKLENKFEEQRNLADDYEIRLQAAEEQRARGAQMILELKQRIDDLSEESEARSHRAAAEISAIQEKLAQGRQQIIQQTTQLTSTLNALEEARNSKLAADAEIERQRAAVELIDRKRAQLEKSVEQQNDVIAKVNEQKSQLESQISELSDDYERSRRDGFQSTSKLTNQLAELQKQLKEQRDENESLNSKVNYWSQIEADKNGRLKDLVHQVETMQQDILELSQDRDKRQMRIRELEVTNSEYANQLLNARRQLDDARADIKHFKMEIERNELAKREFSKEKQALNKSISEMEQVNSKINQEFNDLSKQLDSTNISRFARTQRKVKEQEKVIRELNASLLQLNKLRDQREQNLVQSLREVEANYSQVKDEFEKFRSRIRNCKCSSVTNPSTTINCAGAIEHPTYDTLRPTNSSLSTSGAKIIRYQREVRTTKVSTIASPRTQV
ncbi:hypothetical protein M3Y98_00837300 [Aphelenchoides besseyi]|nr:hypothetical protein M3Y98_00837300 [Aphelenchoides besseyi]